MDISITLGLESIELKHIIPNFYHQINMDDVFIKYNFNLLTDKFELRLQFLATELSSIKKNTVVYGTPCYNLSDIIILNQQLSVYSLVQYYGQF
jgi:hypothetical protein